MMWPEDEILSACFGGSYDRECWRAWLDYARDAVPWDCTTDTYVNVRWLGFEAGWKAARSPKPGNVTIYPSPAGPPRDASE
jgi:hypothetical protein